ncbi:hypothetical protein [Pseudoxanthomonas sp. X-1]|uniref:hypothetical protein n=1 Tax=Pseudoxanthomonas sp. X-1 TaxID=2571115 RepID=UPI00110A49A9|nr:hypothetical protein [Pseudoxanthomonas sp. X-1]TMN24178.1 hypothetical protein FF950_06560 [Pseudoxanthomonas sp. X-1]UAY75143.1 hypothetical protein LAJ50_02430 [Pseudoxanthomonas sp. X-1]
MRIAGFTPIRKSGSTAKARAWVAGKEPRRWRLGGRNGQRYSRGDQLRIVASPRRSAAASRHDKGTAAMLPSTVIERFEKIDVNASRARALVGLLALHYTTADRASELSDEQVVDLLELVEEQLDQVCAQARAPQMAAAA